MQITILILDIKKKLTQNTIKLSITHKDLLILLDFAIHKRNLG